MMLHSSPGLYVTLYRGHRNGTVWFVEVNKWQEIKYTTDLKEFSTLDCAIKFYNETVRSNYEVHQSQM